MNDTDREYIVDWTVVAGIEEEATNGELVRCKDCKYWKKKTMLSLLNAFPITCECEKIYRIESENQFNEMRRTTADWFCADGERRRDT